MRLAIFPKSLSLLAALLSTRVPSTWAVDSPSSYGIGDCLMENCLPSQSGYLEGYNFDPAIVGGPTFGQVWNAQPSQGDQILAQPITYTPSGGSQSVIVASEKNIVSVLDAATGAIRKQRTVNSPFAAVDTKCADLTPNIGITGTPVLDPSSNTLYFWSKTYADGTTSGLDNGRYRFYGVDPVTLQDRFPPVDLQGTQAGNRPDQYFEGGKNLQRTGLLLANGIVYAGFGGHCDNFNYTGWIVGMDASSGKYVTSFSTQSGPYGKTGSGVWQAGGGLSYDGTNMWFVTGNGFGEELGNLPRLGRNPPGALAMSVVKMQLGNLTAVDFFAPSDYRAIDAADQDFGSSGVAFLPKGFSAGNVGRIAIANGKNAKAYIMNADNLGGYKTGNGGGDGNLQTIPLGGQSFSTAGAYPLEGGYVYISSTGQPTLALKFGTDASGNPNFAQVGQTEDASTNIRGVGHTTTTSNNGQAGTGLLWVTDTQNGNLRAYRAIPAADGLLHRIFAGNIPAGGAKYQRPVPGNGRMFIVSTQGYVAAFGAPINLPLNCTSSVNFGTVTIGNSSTLPVTCQAVINTQVSSVKISDAVFKTTTIPTTPLMANQAFAFNVTWTPTAAGVVAGTVTFNTTNSANGYVNTVPVILRGNAVTSGPSFAVTPNNVAFGGLVPGAADSIGGLNKSISLSNVGQQPLTITSWDFDETYGEVDDDDDNNTPAPAGDVDGEMDKKTTTGNFTLYAMPSAIANQSSTALVINFNPTVKGSFTASLKIFTTGGNQTVVITGSAAGAAVFTYSTDQYDGTVLKNVPYMDYGNSLAGSISVQSLHVTNDGESALIISKSKPPTSDFFHATNPTGDLTEGEALEPGETESAAVQLSSPVSQVNVAPYNVSSAWVLNGNDPNFGVHFVNMSARIVSRQVGPLNATTFPGDVNGTARYQYLGCFANKANGGTLPTQLTPSNKNTFENGQCQTLAMGQGNSVNFVGTMYAQECWAGASVPDPKLKVSDEMCTYPCVGDSTQYCGASGYLNIFYDSTTYNAATGTFAPGAYTGPQTAPSSGNYQFVDCVSDAQQNRSLSGAAYTSSTAMSVDSCVSFCSQRGFSLAGVEYAQECYCGNALGAAAQFNQTGCSMTCKGNRNQYCGGPSRLNLYALNGNVNGGVPPPASTTTTASAFSTSTASGSSSSSSTASSTSSAAAPTSTVPSNTAYKGCYSDSTVRRALPFSAKGGTVQACRSACTSAGYSIAGLEYYGECWCGNALAGGSSIQPDTDCNLPCNADSSQICGGSNRLSVYSDAAQVAMVSQPAQVGSWNSLGCYVDSTANRVINDKVPQLGSKTSITSCSQACAGYNFFGVEYGQECYCDQRSCHEHQFHVIRDQHDDELFLDFDRVVYDDIDYNFVFKLYFFYYFEHHDQQRVVHNFILQHHVFKHHVFEHHVFEHHVFEHHVVDNVFCCLFGHFIRQHDNLELEQQQQHEHNVECTAVCHASCYGQSGCNMACSGDSKQMCGGSNRINIAQDTQWKQSFFTVNKAALWRFADCYVDSTQSRVLNVTLTPLNATVEGCLGACNAKNLTLCGVEYGGECYGAWQLPSTAQIAPSTGQTNSLGRGCNKPCNGNSTIACGGSSRLNLYTLNATLPFVRPSQLDYLS
ncbi:hypothetical protein PHSY_003576 [Pseudozyma hubeiensis SY62]|uniref:WSC domain-containing protein n=1 Tax=Pseudozyma hubeiensis (strain SY62) TaxID=1305764 RepID=R9P3H2_PSEHS|nr:hypothetical protein PHSY_003576 [Pseudozyma hubeiensis SY62]GAC95998.1 hypothetical protein PHSY_003576 [Pseudozyma hubeiensis SY62]